MIDEMEVRFEEDDEDDDTAVCSFFELVNDELRESGDAQVSGDKLA